MNGSKKRLTSTIYVSNHPSAFMDPLIIAVLRKPIVFFMTRSDIFTSFTTPIFTNLNMIPIYRQKDGVNAKEKNVDSFHKASETLMKRRSLLIFGEGLTDDVFERRLKPLKKGALRIGFSALESCDWKKEIKISAIGCNYANPNVMRSDLLISESEPIVLNDYKDEYLENPSKIITELTRILETRLIDQLTHITNEKYFDFHHQVMKISRAGMDPISYDLAIPLEKRWKNSQNFARLLNGFEGELPAELNSLKSDLSNYFKKLDQYKLADEDLFRKKNQGSLPLIGRLILLIPLALLGFIHAWIPRTIVRRFVENTFKRRVFWCSTKVLFTMIAMQLFNLPILFFLPGIMGVNFWWIFGYYFCLGFIGLSWYLWMRWFRQLIPLLKKSNWKNLEEIWQERQGLKKRVDELFDTNKFFN